VVIEREEPTVGAPAPEIERVASSFDRDPSVKRLETEPDLVNAI
jgi:hypothetical protein